jgi:hypothetical protein
VLQSVPKNYNFRHVLNGAGVFGRDNQVASKGQIVLFRSDGDQVQIKEASTLSLLTTTISTTAIEQSLMYC